jgi:hypothetical protein
MVGSGSWGGGGEVVVSSDVDKVVDDLEEHDELGELGLLASWFLVDILTP